MSYFLDIMIELMNHEILIVFIYEDGIFLECLFDLDKFIKVLLSLKRSVEKNINFENSNYRIKILLEHTIVIGLTFLIFLLHGLNHFVVMFECVNIILLCIVFRCSLIVLKPGLLSNHVNFLLRIKIHFSWSKLVLYWLSQTIKWTSN